MARKNRLLSADKTVIPSAPKPGSTAAQGGGPDRGEPLTDDLPPQESTPSAPKTMGGSYDQRTDKVTTEGLKKGPEVPGEKVPGVHETLPGTVAPPRGDEDYRG